MRVPSGPKIAVNISLGVLMLISTKVDISPDVALHVVGAHSLNVSSSFCQKVGWDQLRCTAAKHETAIRELTKMKEIEDGVCRLYRRLPHLDSALACESAYSQSFQCAASQAPGNGLREEAPRRRCSLTHSYGGGSSSSGNRCAVACESPLLLQGHPSRGKWWGMVQSTPRLEPVESAALPAAG